MQDACPTPGDVPFFNRCMARAREMGLEWERALDYVIEQRKVQRVPHLEPEHVVEYTV